MKLWVCNYVTHTNPCGAATTCLVWANTWHVTCLVYKYIFFALFFGLCRVRTSGPILTIYTSYGVFMRILGSHSYRSIFRGSTGVFSGLPYRVTAVMAHKTLSRHISQLITDCNLLTVTQCNMKNGSDVVFVSVYMPYQLCWLLWWIWSFVAHCGSGVPSVPPLFLPLSIHFLIVCSFLLFPFLTFLICFTYFLLLSIPFLSTRIVPLCFQAWGHRRWPNRGLLCCIHFVLSVLPSWDLFWCFCCIWFSLAVW